MALMKQQLRLRLNDPGMTSLHRAGLAGLWMTLAALTDMERRGDLDWPALLDEPPKLEPHGVELAWNSNPRELVRWLREESFKIENGLIEFAPLQNANKEAKVEIHKAVLGTFLQHGRTRGLKKCLVTHPLQIDDTLLLLNYA